MLKTQLEHELVGLRAKLESSRITDKFIREKISGFLGSIERSKWSNTDEIKILSWPEIYFELGKKFEKADRLENLDSIKNELQFLLDKVNKLEIEIEKS